ncbi:hypothetical protein EV691_13619 [Azotobacter chroococcum]|uniref:Uncharacterized protein n=1 Tax=Azotobacter chroococcum TaxID=353 RepID=A0A4R1P823_9GAMM|nr:hypothetical protein EV691_13619 [Azotobacter chroococcum]
MKPHGRRTAIALLLAALCGPVLAGPHGPGHGHGLPDFAREVWIGSTLYFLAAGTYYCGTPTASSTWWSSRRPRCRRCRPTATR